MSHAVDRIAVRCAVLVDPIAKQKGFTQGADAAGFTASSGSLIALALRELVAQASDAAKAYARECRWQGVEPRPEIMALKVPDEADLLEEAFHTAMKSTDGTSKFHTFLRGLEKFDLRVVFAEPSPTP
ncbi:hypothetical protein [Novosphingobium sp.]|uniref:hypothetical protein n=1 Tax=Novosphingobium sp. TaxID=1874826 RepID=UPI0031D48F5F